MRFFLYLSILLLTTSCASSVETPFVSSEEFNEDDIAWAKDRGKTKIEGSSFIVDRMGLNGTTHTCAGYSALLLPQSDFFEEYFNYLFDNLEDSFWDYKGSIPYKRLDFPSYESAGVRESKCDIDGKFEFKNVPSGTYHINTTVYYIGGPLRTIPPDYKGGMFLKRIVVNDEDSLRVVLTK